MAESPSLDDERFSSLNELNRSSFVFSIILNWETPCTAF